MGIANNVFSYYENDQRQIRLACNDFYYYENYHSQKKLAYNNFLYCAIKHIIGITDKIFS